jgi:hypothetical protein
MILILALVLLNILNLTASDPYNKFNYQGVLTNSDGTLVTDGTYDFVFNVYDVSTGGTTLSTFTKSGVSVSKGLFQVEIGEAGEFEALDFVANAYYLEITVGSTVLSPRIEINPVAKAIYARNLKNGAVTGADISGSNIQNTPIGSTTASTGAFTSLSAGTNKFTVDTDGNITKINNVTTSFPSTQGSANTVLKNDGSGNLTWGSASGSPSGSAGGDLTGTYPNPTIANDAITSAKILDGTVSNSDISANAITTSKVANGTVTTSKMADSAISGLKLLTYAVTNRHLANGAVDGTKIALGSDATGDVMYYNGSSYVRLAAGTNGQVLTLSSGVPAWSSAGGGSPTGSAGGDLTGTYPNPSLANSSITSAKILDGTITDSDVSTTAAIAYSKLSLTNSVQNGDIVANAITTSKVANGTVTTSKMADSAISGLKLLTNAVTNRHIASGAVDGTKIALGSDATGDVMYYNGSSYVRLAAGTNGQVLTLSSGVPAWSTASGGAPSGAAGGDLSGTFPNPTIASGAVDGTKIADGTITNADIAAAAGIPYSKLTLTNSVLNTDLVANSVTTSKVANGTVTTSKMADSAISGLKLLTGAVTTTHISNNAVTGAKIALGSDATGDMMYYNGTDYVRLAAGTNGQVLGLSSGVPTWVSSGSSYLKQSFSQTLNFASTGFITATYSISGASTGSGVAVSIVGLPTTDAGTSRINAIGWVSSANTITVNYSSNTTNNNIGNVTVIITVFP